MTEEIPLFPLHSVLFPGGLLQLKVFEARYLDLMSRCLRLRQPFGVVTLRGGRDGRAGSEPIRFEPFGTLAELLEVDSAARGMLSVRCRGTQRFRISASREQADGLRLAAAEPMAADETLVP